MRPTGGGSGRWLARVLACCVAGVVGLLLWVGLPEVFGGSGARFLANADVSHERAAPGVSLGSLVVPGLQPLDQNQQVVDARQVLHSSSAAYNARLRSRMEFAHLGTTRVALVARDTFPMLIDEHAGGAPTLPAGDRIVRYSSPDVAQIELSGGKRAVLESLAPVAMPTTSGRFTPIDLALTDTGSSYTPAASDVAVQIPKRLNDGVRASGAGVSLTPVTASGSPLVGTEGTVDDASVVYANTQIDSDTVAKPTSTGFDVSAILRSVDSPHQLYYRIGMPSGAALVQRHHRGPVQVVVDGVAIATIMPASALDASGAAVPVSMSIEGAVLALEVGNGSREYQYPLEVDPELVTVQDRSLTGAVFPVEEYKGGTNWKPFMSAAFSEERTYKKSYSCGGGDWEWCEQSWYIEPISAYNANEYAGLQYETQGESKAYRLEAWVEGENEPSEARSQIEFLTHEGRAQTNNAPLSNGPFYNFEPAIVGPGGTGEPSETPPGNVARIIDYTTKPESLYGFWMFVSRADIYVAQEKGPETSPTTACSECGFNTTSPTIAEAGGRPNVLYGAGSWLSPSQGAYEATAHDPGIGISFAAFSGAGMSEERFIREKEGDCSGIQCTETYARALTYLPTMANGEDSIEFLAKDAAGMYGYTTKTIKVDAEKPYNLGFSGMPETGAEISAAPHKLTVHATDGKKPIPSSGVKSIGVSIDGGKETMLSGSSCPEGECEASGAYTLSAEALTEGVHSLTVTATDNAGNIASRPFYFDVRHGSPVSVGPGTVDPTSGQFTLSAQDVSLGGSSGVTRTYQSRNLAAGAEGPLGPQWAMSVGGGERLNALSNGNVMLVAANGGQTTFTLNSKGEFESPKGDENLKIEYESKERKYLLKNAIAGTETVFEQPTGFQNTAPVYGDQFGAEAADLNRPVSDSFDSVGDLWVTDWEDNRVAEFSAAGTLMNTYGSYGSEAGQLNRPWGIAINQKTNNVYVSDWANNRIEEFSSSGAFVKAFGWGVSSNGNSEYEICTKECKAGFAGAGNSQFDGPEGVAVDSSGNIWVADSGNNRVEEFNEEGKLLLEFGSTGTGAGQFNGPTDFAFSGSNVYVSDQTNNRIEEFSSSGAFVKAFGWGVSNGNSEFEICTSGCQAGKSGSGVGQFNEPRGLATDAVAGNLYIAEVGNNRVQEFTPAGAVVTKFGTGGSGQGQFSAPIGIAINSSGKIYVADFYNARIDEWKRQTWVPTTGKGPTSSALTTYSYKAVTSAGETVIEPAEELGPKPEGAACSAEPEKSGKAEKEKEVGCRELTFKYGTKTSAGEKESEWNEYDGRLMEVKFTAYNPASKEMQTKAVARYAYDKLGRLRVEWDPRISPELTTVYGYDAGGHVTAISPPGQEPWLLHYGAIVGDSNTGRLLSVTRLGASIGLWNGEAVTNTAVPTLSSTSPVIGTTLSVSSNGTWSDGPLANAYGYQWEDCIGSQCTAVAGATNHTYTPQVSDAGYTLVVQVTATNAGGSVVASSAATSAVPISAPKYSLAFGSSGIGAGDVKAPIDAAIDSSGHIWVTDNANERIDEFTSTGTFIKTLGFGVSNGKAEFETCTSSCQAGIAGSGNGQFNGPWGIAINQTAGDVYVTDQGNSRVEEFTTLGSFVRAFGSAGTFPGQFGVTAGVEVDPNGNVWVADYSNNRVEEFTATGVFMQAVGSAGSGNGQFSGPGGFAFVGGDMYVADFGNKRIQEFSLSGEYLGQFASVGEPYEIDGNSVTGEIYESDLSGKVDEFNRAGTLVGSFGTKGTGSGQFESPTGLAVNASGDIYVVDHGNSRIQEWTPTYSTNNPLSEPPSVGSSSVSTIEYHLPVTGTGRPNLPNMTKEEVEKWGQKDISESEDNDPSEGMAIFPPDEPQGWPASSYKRATIDYMNEKGLTVDTSTPSGGVSTTEYNELNAVTRTLSPDNQARAMAEGCKSVEKKECKSAEVSKLLDNKSEYDPETHDLIESLGPQHIVKLANGSETEARSLTSYYYDENAPEKSAYHLVTKTISAALVDGDKEEDRRTTNTSYSGQNNLGWKLRKPTSVTTDPGGLNLTTTTVYQESENVTKEMESTGAVVETRSPEGSDYKAPPFVSLAQFGSSGSGNGQLNHPMGVAVDGSGNVWVADGGNDRIQKFSSAGAFIGAYGSKGAGAGQFEVAWGIAVNKTTGNVYATDPDNNRVQEFSSTGGFIRTFGFGVSNGEGKLEICTSSCRAGIAGTGSGQFRIPTGITVDPAGNVWVVDRENDRVEEFKENGEYVGQFGSKGTGNGQFAGPEGIAISDGDVYVTDTGNDRVEEFSPAGIYLGQWGSKGAGSGQFNVPLGIATDSVSGALFVADGENSRVEEFSRTGTFLTEIGSYGTGEGHIWEAADVALTPAGSVYVADKDNDRVDQWEPIPSTPVYTSQFGSTGTAGGQFEGPERDAVDASGDVWVTDHGNHRIEELSPSGTFKLAVGWGVKDGKAEAETCTAECRAGIAGSGNGQLVEPWGIAVNQSSGDVYVSDYGSDRVEEFSSTGTFVASFGSKGSGPGQLNLPEGMAIDSGGDVWVADENNMRVDEFSSGGTFMMATGWGVKDGKAEAETCTTVCQAGIAGSGSGELDGPAAIAISNGNVYVADYGNRRVDEFSSSGAYVSKFGSGGKGNGQFEGVYGIATDPTSGDLYVVDSVNDRVQEFTPSGTFLAAFGTDGSGNGQFVSPRGVAVNSAGDVYVIDHNNNRIEQWTPAPRPGNEGAHDARVVYYSAKGEAEVAACQNHPEWANLPCQAAPAAQPGTSGAPELPVITTRYNVWDEPETVEEKFGSTTRTKKETFDGAGREETGEVFSSPAIDKATPVVTDKYSKTTGALIEQSTTTEGKTKTITSVYNTLGQLEKYIDANGDTTKYTYEAGGDKRLDEVSYEIGKEKFGQIYAYNATTGLMESVYDSGLKKYFTATYDIEGKILTDTYPNNLVATYTYNQVDAATGIKYEKTANCASKCPEIWFEDSVVPSVHGETLKQSSTLAKESYAYDNDGRLGKTEETPTGKGCTSRLYAYDEESNRASLTTRTSATETCSTEGGAVEAHAYDSANALIDPGVIYETLGNITKLPAPDAGKYELKSSYYVDNQVASQTQQEAAEKEKTLNYVYDPDGRTEETEAIVKEYGKEKHEPIETANYSGAGGALTWTGEEENKKWIRNVPGIDGGLDAIQTSAGANTLQLHDLEGNVVGTVGLSEVETKLSSTYNSTEFGVPTTTSVPKYAWLGSTGVASELPSSGTVTEDSASYVPEIGRNLQTAPIIQPGALPNGPGGGTLYTPTVSAASIAEAEAEAKKITEETEAARQKAKAEEAAATLRKCREEGGCGANTGAGTSASGQAPTEPTEEEYRILEREVEESEGGDEARTASLDIVSIPGWAKSAVISLAHSTTHVLQGLADRAEYWVEAQIHSPKKRFEFNGWVSDPLDGEASFSCFSESTQHEDQYMVGEYGGPDNPYEDLFNFGVGAEEIYGCIQGAL